MKAVCPICEAVRDIEEIVAPEVIKVRGEDITVISKRYKCSTCREEFDDPESTEDPVEKAYRIYRDRRHMVQPEKILEFRKQYGLTQRELSDILGWGVTSLIRYESGSLQTEAHDKELRLAMIPVNLLLLLQESEGKITESKRQRLIELLQQQEAKSSCMISWYEIAQNQQIDAYSGFNRFDLQKLNSAILFFCTGEGVFKTVLNKLLFYADFRHFREYTVSITGARYVHVPFGPVPDNFDLYFAALKQQGMLYSKEEFFNNFSGERLIAQQSPDISLFSASEVRILAEVKERLGTRSAKWLSEASHEETAYQATRDGEAISYDYAAELKNF